MNDNGTGCYDGTTGTNQRSSVERQYQGQQMSDDQSDMGKSIVYSQNPLLYEGAAEPQTRAAPFSFSYKKEREEHDNYDRGEQVWTPNGAVRGNEDQQFAPLERNGTAAAET